MLILNTNIFGEIEGFANFEFSGTIYKMNWKAY